MVGSRVVALWFGWLLLAGCPGSAPSVQDSAAVDSARVDRGPGSDGPAGTDGPGAGDHGTSSDAAPADPSAYLHANVWSIWWNDRTRCGAERTFLEICTRRQAGGCSLYQQAVSACDPKMIVYGQVGPEKSGEKLCQQSKHPTVGGCEASKYDFNTLRFWWYGAEWQGNWPLATIKVFKQGQDWKGSGELIALSSVPGAAQAAMSGIKNHGLGYGCAMPGKTSGSDAEMYRKPFGGFAWIKVPTNEKVTVAALAATNFANTSFAGCNRGGANQTPWVTAPPGATMGCVYISTEVTFKPGKHYYWSYGQITELPTPAPPAELVAGFALPEVGLNIATRAACKL